MQILQITGNKVGKYSIWTILLIRLILKSQVTTPVALNFISIDTIFYLFFLLIYDTGSSNEIPEKRKEWQK